MEYVKLPRPRFEQGPALAAVLNRRRSHRSFLPQSLEPTEVGQILWAGSGSRGGGGAGRTAPSAGACYPIEVFACTGPGTVTGLDAGVFRYVPQTHELEVHRLGDFRSAMARAALDQTFIAAAPLVLVITAEFSRTTSRYGGERGMRYVYMDAGHVSQNVYLQAEALALGTVAVGAFRDQELLAAGNLPGYLKPLYVMPVGRPAPAGTEV